MKYFFNWILNEKVMKAGVNFVNLGMIRPVFIALLIFCSLEGFTQVEYEETPKEQQQRKEEEKRQKQEERVQKRAKRLPSRFPLHYHILSISNGNLFANNPGNDVNVSIPYTSVSSTSGASETNTFNGALNKKFTNPVRTLGLLYESIFKGHNDVALGIGGFWSDGGDHGLYLQGGYRYVLHFGWFDLKPGADLFYLSGTNSLGSIDNYQKTLYFKQFTGYDQFYRSTTVTYTDDDGNTYDDTETHAYDANRTNVKYKRHATLVEPKMAFSTHFARLSVSLEAGYMLQLGQSSMMKFEQFNDATGKKNGLGTIPMERNGDLSGIKLGLTVGILL